METSPVTCRTLEEFYHIDGHTFEKQYKEVLSGYRRWDQLSHADEWMLFPENMGPHLAIDETSLSNGELYTFVTNRDACTRECSLVAVVAGTKSEDVIAVLQRIDEKSRYAVKEVTLDLSDSMRKIVRTAFPKANRVIDRFHIQKLACDAVQELRIEYRWDAIQQANEEMEEAKQKNEDYVPYRYSNGDTRRELLIRSRYLLFKSADKWTERQKQRAAILFEEYPDIKKAYGLCHSLRMIFSKNTIKDAARLAMARWYKMDEHYRQLLEEFNAAMREQLKIMRLETIKAYSAVIETGISGKIEAVGKCFMGYVYSRIHPIQTVRAKKIWEVLSGALDEYDPLYEDGVISNGWHYQGGKPETENVMLYLSEKRDNWNEGLDCNQTRNMNIIHAVHNLYDHTAFSIFDLLWVRDFNMEIHVEVDYSTYKTDGK